MSEVRVKKSVALSGVVAGDTALSTVGHSGNDLHYRGYEINDLAQNCEFEEVAYLILYGALPTKAQLTDYKSQLSKCACLFLQPMDWMKVKSMSNGFIMCPNC